MECKVEAYDCQCGLPEQHKGPHKCSAPFCGGSWEGSPADGSFKVKEFPGLKRIFGDDDE